MMMGAVRTTGTSIHDESSGVCQISVAGAEKWTRPSSTMSEDGTLFDVDDPFAHQDTRPADPGAHDESLSLLRARLQDAVGMSSEGNLDGGCEMQTLRGHPAFDGNTNVLSEKLNSRAICCICRSERPSALGKTAS